MNLQHNNERSYWKIYDMDKRHRHTLGPSDRCAIPRRPYCDAIFIKNATGTFTAPLQIHGHKSQGQGPRSSAAAAAIHETAAVHTAAVPIQHTAAVPAAVPICHTVSLIISVPVAATTTVVAIHCAARDVSVGLPVIRLGEHPDAAPSAPADNTAACDTISGASCYLIIGCHRLNQHSCLHIGIIVSERQFGTVYWGTSVHLLPMRNGRWWWQVSWQQ